jgi:hypothetical protein
MKPTRKPPPDDEVNVRGRILALRTEARRAAAMDAKEGADPERALAKRLKGIEPRLKKFRARLAKARKSAPTPPIEPPKKPKTKTRARKGTTKVDDQGDILETLGVSVG